MATYSTKLAEAFGSQVMQIFYQMSVSDRITNTDYEGEIRDKSSILNILTLQKILSQNYTGSNLTVNDIAESSGQLITDQAKAFYYRIRSYDKFRSYIKNPEATLQKQTALELKKLVDQFVLGLYTKVAAGQRLGTAVVNVGTVAVSSGGAVTGSGTSFSAAMVGRGFQAAGQTSWYKVASVTNSTTMQIYDDLDDSGANAYTGGVINSGANYTVEAVTPVQVTRTTIYDYINQLTTLLNKVEIPDEDRWMVVSPDIYSVIKEAPEFIPSGVDKAYEDVVLNGKVGRILNAEVFMSARTAGDNVNGYHCMLGHKSAITFAMGFVEAGMEDLIGNFGKAYKSLNVYGAKVVDERRKALTELFCYK